MYVKADVKEFLVEVEQCMCEGGGASVSVGDDGPG